jgi:hypothetical protein
MCSSDSDCGADEGKCVIGPSHFNPNYGCVCNQTAGFYNIQNNYSEVGYNCKNLCTENPCGNRGTCYIEEITPSTNPKTYTYKCKDCSYPYSNDGPIKDYTCNNIKLPTQANCKSNDECASGNCGPIDKMLLGWLDSTRNVCL